MSKQKQEGVPSALSELECPQISCGSGPPQALGVLVRDCHPS